MAFYGVLPVHLLSVVSERRRVKQSPAAKRAWHALGPLSYSLLENINTVSQTMMERMYTHNVDRVSRFHCERFTIVPIPVPVI